MRNTWFKVFPILIEVEYVKLYQISHVWCNDCWHTGHHGTCIETDATNRSWKYFWGVEPGKGKGIHHAEFAYHGQGDGEPS